MWDAARVNHTGAKGAFVAAIGSVAGGTGI